MRHLFVLLFGLSALFAPAQPTANSIDAKGRKQGVWSRTWADSEQVRYTGQFEDDRPVGRFTYYSTEGLVESIVDHYPDGSGAHARHFHPNGGIMAEGRYIGQAKDSIWVYLDDAGIRRTQEHWMKGRKHGEEISYFEDGTISERITFVNGVQEGEHEQFFPGGQLKHHGKYVRGEGEGVMTWYYPDGKKEMEGHLVNGERDGIWYYFNADGSVQIQMVYDRGTYVKDKKENGVFKEYCDDEQLRSEHTWKQGKLNGPFTEYYCNGTWVDEPLPVDQFGAGQGETQRVLKGQLKKREGTYRNGVLHGLVIDYGETGSARSRVEYVDGTPLTTSP
ncbi:MAG: toxin-antitoxin system YwqK family antitoxin [Flavobacteriales bacterium]|nr:toxin-antitoxin system YwqK family antitoxin [Flavobacteriales bacterium]MBP6697563.1 toxin-antitoxin system YwqK family antitoxin [Flavobacteriales bacterium]